MVVSMLIFTEAHVLIKEVEKYLVPSINGKYKFLNYFWTLVVLPLFFLKIGIVEKIKSIAVLIILYPILIVVACTLVNTLSISEDQEAILFIQFILVPIFLAILAVPSAYAASGINQSLVSFIAQFLKNRGFSSVKDIELLKKSIKPFEDRAQSRINALKWLVGFVWACFIYATSRMFMKNLDATSLISAEHYTELSEMLFISIAILSVCVWSYEASLNKLFRAIEFGCNDLSHIIENSSSNLMPVNLTKK